MAKTRSKILIVEDDKFILKAMTYKFEEAGFEVKPTRSANEGLQILEVWEPAAIVLDILLPGIDGYAFLRTVKANPRLKHIPVIIASNLNEDKEVKSDVVDYIVKSDLDLDELVLKTQKHIT